MSKELKALENIGYDYYKFSDTKGRYENVNETEEYEIIETTLKALEIIKEKKVNVGDFVFYLTINEVDGTTIPQEVIFDLCCGCSRFGEPLTQEEYDLLKEVLL